MPLFRMVSDCSLGFNLSAANYHIIATYHSPPYHNIVIGLILTSRPIAKIITFSSRHTQENHRHSIPACPSVPGNPSRSMAEDQRALDG